MSGFDVDLFVIGAGSGGVRAARMAASHGAKVMLAEEFRVGGTCVIRGCVPKKLYVYASRFSGEFDDAAGFGWHVPPATFDWATLVAAKEKEITRLEAIYAKTQANAGVDLVRSRAVLEDAHTVRLIADGRRIRAGTILIATGAHPYMPALPGVEHAISSNEVFDLPQQPEHIVIAGGGYIAVEFAGIFAGLGSKVTLAHRGDNILRGFDEDLRNAVRSAYEQRGIRLVLGQTITNIDRPGRHAVTLSGGEQLEADAVLLALGRTPNVAGLGLDKAGVALNAGGAIAVNASSQTSVAHIYAVGDVTDRVNLTPVAIREGHAFADSVFGGKPWLVDHANIATAVYSTPELGTVGLTETQARERHRVVDIYKTDFRPMKATLSGAADRMMMKIIVDGESDRVLGVHIAGEAAGEMAQLLGIAVKMGATKADFDATVAVHPTAAEELVTLRTRSARFVRS
ncbi:MAG: glutathione-disulfide reductase [Proteobacteria bacterium]|nr:glutathione-disulfide reductase [Pseudomonadota bacterium]